MNHASTLYDLGYEAGIRGVTLDSLPAADLDRDLFMLGYRAGQAEVIEAILENLSPVLARRMEVA